VEFEADDALEAAADAAARDARVERVIICTPDKDLAQCVRGTRIVQLNRRTGITLDDSGVIKKFGVSPESIPDYLALVGDSADGYPGLPGWGAKSSLPSSPGLSTSNPSRGRREWRSTHQREYPRRRSPASAARAISNARYAPDRHAFDDVDVAMSAPRRFRGAGGTIRRRRHRERQAALAELDNRIRLTCLQSTAVLLGGGRVSSKRDGASDSEKEAGHDTGSAVPCVRPSRELPARALSAQVASRSATNTTAPNALKGPWAHERSGPPASAGGRCRLERRRQR
jgi:hypothetical protein